MNASRSPVAIGDVVGGRYKIEAFLGDGGMAVVYQARHTGTGKVCALKIIHPHLITRSSLVELFVREAQVGARIGPNPHVVDVFDAGADEARGVPFFAMELLQGQNLERYCKERGAMPPALVSNLVEQLADALDQAHRAGVVHRDIKPSNLFLTADHKGQPLLKVVDFGIAKVLEGDQLTATQIGTPSYAAPEQLGAGFYPVAARQGIQISTIVSPATDVWAMGLVAYEMLTGLPAGQFWGATTPAELPLKVVLDEHAPATVRAGDRAGLLPPGFDAWFARCTRKNAAERWPTAGQAAAELGRLLTPGAAGATFPGAPAAAVEPFGATAVAPYTPAGPMTPPGPGGAPMQPHAPSAYGGASYGPGPVQPYGMAPARSAYGQPATAAAKTGAGCLVPALIAVGVTVVVMSLLGVFAWRRFQLTASASACEKDGKRCEEACNRSDLTSCARLGRQHETGSGASLDPARAAELYQQACDGGDGLGCALLGQLHLRGRGGKLRDPTEARRLAEAACDKGAQLGCAILGELYRDGAAGLARDDARARGLFQGACDAGEMLACKDLGGMYKWGRGGLAKDPARAAALYKQACDGGNATGCNDLGVLYGTGTGFAKDMARAAALYQQSCDGGEPLGCDNLGGVFLYGNGFAKDDVRAAALYKQACEGGEPRGCTDWGYMHEYGKGGVPKDDARAVALYKQGCDGDDATGCGNLGVMTESGRGTAKDEAHAAALYKKACDGGNGSACTNLGVMTELGKGGLAKNDAAAATLYKEGCDAGSAQGCTNYGLFLDGARGVTKDSYAATARYKQACDKDNAGGCANLGWHYLKGIGVQQDRPRGLVLLRKACSADYSWACDKLKENGAGGLR